MASDVSKVTVEFHGEDKGVQKTADNIKKGLAFGAASQIGSAAISAVGNAAKNLVGDVINVGSSFTSSMSEVKAISGASGEEFSQLTAKAREMGAKTVFSASQAGDAMKYMAMAGWDSTQMMAGIEGVMNLAAASGEDLASVSDIVTNAITAFGDTAEDSGRYADTLAKAAASANVDVGMLGESFKYVAPVAGAMSYSMEDTAFALGIMGSAGIQASSAGTALRSMLTNLASPTDAVQGAMDRLGISLTDESGQMKDMRTLIDDLRASFSGLSEEEAAAEAAAIAGKQGMSGLLALVNTSEEDFNKLSSAMENTEGAAQLMADTMNDNLGGDLAKLNSAVEEVQITLYTALEPIFRQVVQWITANVIPALQSLAEWFGKIDLSKFTEPLSKLNIDWGKVLGIAGIAAAVVAAKNFLGGLSKINPFKSIGKSSKGIVTQIGTTVSKLVTSVSTGMSKIINSVGTASSKLIKSLGQALKVANPVNILALGAAVGVVVAAFALLATQGDGVAKIFESIGNAASTLVQGIGTAIATIITACGPQLVYLGQAVAIAAEGIGTAFSGIITAITPVIGVLTGAIAQIVQTITDAIVQIVAILAPYIPEITTMLQVICDCFNGLAQTIADAIVQIVQALAPYIPSIQEMITATSEAIQAICVTFQQLISQIVPVLHELESIISTVFHGINQTISTICQGLTEVLTAFGQTFKDVGQGIKTAFDGVADVITAFGDAVKSVLEGVAGIIDSVGNACLNAGTGFKRLAEGLRIISELDGWGLAGSLTAAAAGIAAIAGACSGLGDSGNQMLAMGQGLMLIAQSAQMAGACAPALETLAIAMAEMVSVAPQMIVVGSAMQSMATASMGAAQTMNQTAMAMAMITATLATIGSGVQTLAGNFLQLASSAESASIDLFVLQQAVNQLSASFLALEASSAWSFGPKVASASAIAASAMESLSASVGICMAEMQSEVASGMSGMVKSIQSAMTPLPNFVKGVVDKVTSNMRRGADQARSAGKDIGQGFVAGIAAYGGPAASAGRALKDAATSGMAGGYTAAYNAGADIGAGLYNGLSGWADRVSALASQISAKIDEVIRKKQEIASPSKLQRKNGAYIGEGLALGIKSSYGQVEKAAAKLAGIPESASTDFGASMSFGMSMATPDDQIYEIHVHSHLDGREVAHETYKYTKKEMAQDNRLRSALGGVR